MLRHLQNFTVTLIIARSEYMHTTDVFGYTIDYKSAPFMDRPNCMFTGDFYFEYTTQGVDKAKTINAAFGRLCITKEEMIAFGDAENDPEMLKYVGCGVAMGNASEAVKSAADEVTSDNNHDGIAESLKKHGII